MAQRRGRQTTRIGALNVRTLQGKELQIEELLDRTNLDIFVVGETRLNDNRQPADIEGFEFAREDGTDGYGGIGVYIENTIVYNILYSHSYEENNVQFLHIEITNPICLDLIAIYSSPHNQNRALTLGIFDHYLRCNRNRNVPVMFIGDINIDFQRNTKWDKIASRYIERKQNPPYNLRQLIKKPTHDGKTCIDHIITNLRKSRVVVPPVRVTKMNTDHSMIRCRVDHNNPIHQFADNETNLRHLVADHTMRYCRRRSCYEVFTTEQLLNAHIRDAPEHHQCDRNDCNKVFTTPNSLNQHVSDKHNNTFKCRRSKCHERFDTEEELTDHIRTSLNHFKCPTCPKVYTTKQYWKKHKNNH